MGIDRQGCDQLEGKLKNTNKWIGATEIVAFLTSRGIRTELLDFHIPTASDGSHPRLFQWVLDYFRSNQGIVGKFLFCNNSQKKYRFEKMET